MEEHECFLEIILSSSYFEKMTLEPLEPSEYLNIVVRQLFRRFISHDNEIILGLMLARFFIYSETVESPIERPQVAQQKT